MFPTIEYFFTYLKFLYFGSPKNTEKLKFRVAGRGGRVAEGARLESV
jgi:hypothetical protein